MKDLVIYGCGSVGRMVEQIVFDINKITALLEYRRLYRR